MVDISKSTEFYQNQEQQSCAAKLCSKATFSVQKFMEINLNPGFFLPASEYFRRHKDVQKRHSGSLSPLLEALFLFAFVLSFSSRSQPYPILHRLRSDQYRLLRTEIIPGSRWQANHCSVVLRAFACIIENVRWMR